MVSGVGAVTSAATGGIHVSIGGGSKQSGGSSSAYGQASGQSAYGGQTSSAFSGQTSSAYGGQTSSAYGQPYGGQTSPAFSGQTSSAYGGQPSSAYGQPSSAYGGQTTSAYGGQTSAYGGASSAYGQPSSAYGGQTSSAYGGQSAYSGQNSAYGQPSSVYSGQTTSAYGGQTSSAYGGQTPSQGGSSLFGNNIPSVVPFASSLVSPIINANISIQTPTEAPTPINVEETVTTPVTPITPAGPITLGEEGRLLPVRFYLRTSYGRYLGADRLGYVFAKKSIPSETEVWTAQWLDDTIVILRSQYGSILGIDLYGNTRAMYNNEHATANWNVTQLEGDNFAFRCINGYLSFTQDGKATTTDITSPNELSVWVVERVDYGKDDDDDSSDDDEKISKLEEEIKSKEEKLANWKMMPGKLEMISVGKGEVWAVNKNSQIFKWINGAWKQIVGNLSFISVGSDGSVFGCTKHKEIQKYKNENWESVSGQLEKISVSSSDLIWGLDGHGYPWRYNGLFFSQIKKKKLKSISVGSDGEVWGVLKKGKRIAKWNNSKSNWTPINEDDGHRWVSVSVVDSKNIWAVEKRGLVYKFEPVTGGWTFMGGHKFVLIAASENSVWALDHDKQVYQLASSEELEENQKEVDNARVKEIVEQLKNEVETLKKQLAEANAKYQRDLEAARVAALDTERLRNNDLEYRRTQERIVQTQKEELDRKLAEIASLNRTVKETVISQQVVVSEQRIQYNTWEINVVTGGMRGSGTDANVDIVLYGANSQTEPQRLENSPYNFRMGREDNFKVVIQNDIGPLVKISIGHDNSGIDPSWYLERLTIFNSVYGTYKFSIGKWLKVEDDTTSVEATPIEGDFNIPKVKNYTITVITGDRPGAGTDSNVTLTIFGENGSREEALATPIKGFNRKSESKHRLDNINLGKLKKLRIGHDNSGFQPAWFLEKVVVRDETDAKDYFFLCGQWLSSKEATLVIELDAHEDDGRASLPMATYVVQVITGDRRGAGTDANVSITLYGQNDSSSEKILDTSADNFERAKTDVFSLELVDLGELTKIRIGHDNSGFAPAWFLDKVIIKKNDSDKIWYFLFGNWISKVNGTSVEIAATNADGVTCLPLVSYKITIATGDIRGAGTDANVSIVIYGENGDTGNRFLDSSGNDFERAHTDVFGLQAVDLGKLSKIRIGHDNAGFGAAWFLDKVIIRNEATGEDYYFLAGRWLSTHEEDGNTYCEIAAQSADGTSYQKLLTYKVTVYTGNRRGAGTDANVGVIIFGEKGDSGRRLLSNSRNNFERGRIDVFGFQCVDLGDLKRITIGHDNSGTGPGWFLSKVDIDVGDGKSWSFGANRWLARDEEDGKIELDLAPSTGEFKVIDTSSYVIEVLTGDRRGAGTNANVFITLFGQDGKKSREFFLDNSQDNFERKKKDVFQVECDDLGDLTKIRVGHDNKGLFAAWFLDKVVVFSERQNKRYFFLAGKWLDSKEGTVAEIAATGEDGRSCLPLIRYTVKVKTGDRRFAGTDANVFINIVGSNGDTGKRELNNSSNNYERNKWDEFEIEAVDLGNLEKVQIGHDNSGAGPGWFLEKIVIFNQETQKETFFLCGRWLDKSEDDGLIARELPASNADGVACAPTSHYHIQVWTGDRRGAGTDANVTINVVGDTGETGDFALVGKGNKFERNRCDEFMFEAVHLGNLKKIRIGHDNSGAASGWFLDKVIIREEHGSLQWYFLSGRWFDKHEDDGATVREIEAKPEDGTTYAPLSTYDVDVITGDRHGAGTNANVFVTIFGDKGDTGSVQLEGKGQDFERNTNSHFSITSGNLGALQSIKIGHDNKGFGSAWFLDKVVITDHSREGKKFYFPCGKWLATDEEDGQLYRTIAALEEDKQSYLPLSMYQVTVSTGDRRGAGTDANVYINIIGEYGESGQIPLDNEQNNFERNKVDKFTIESVELGNVKQIMIGHDNKGIGAAWFLDKVVVKSERLGKDFYFLCGQWLATDEGDGAIQRTISAQDADGVASAPLVTYKIEVYTANKRGAGTDANVFINLFGENSDSGQRPLDNNQNNFERGKKDVFSVEAVDLGETLKKIRIGHDNAGFGPGWLLEKVVVTDQRRNKVYYFLSGQWFDLHEGDNQIVREISSTTEDGAVGIPMRDYQIQVITGDRDGAGTDAKVNIALYGENGSTIDMNLDTKGNNFERNKTDEFTLNCIDLGTLKKVRIGHDNSGSAPGWFLEKVIIKPVAKDGEGDLPSYYFFCGRWLAKDEDDGQIVRELAGSTTDEKSSLPWVHYRVKIYTGDRRGAGTDANVFLTVYGENGDSGQRRLDKKGDLFERNQLDEFEFELIDLGPITKLRIGHDNSGAGPGWFLDKVIVEAGSGQTYFFLFGKWLAQDEEDKQIIRECAPSPVDATTYLPEVNYQVSVYTGDRWGAGTDANVFIELYGENGTSGRKLLDNANDNFERGKVDVFGVLSVDLGQLTKIRIGHDNSGVGPGWFLDKIVIRSEKEQKEYFFLSGRWYATDEEDKLIEREIPASDKDGNTYLPICKYKVSIVTGDRFGAGTDANVFLTIYGENGDSGKKVVDPPGNSFERSKTDVVGIEAVDLGKLTKIRIGHDNSGVGPGWFLEKVIIENLTANTTTYFLCGQWLSSDEADGQIVREIAASNEDGVACLPMKTYTIKVKTGDRWGAGTDANVSIIIYGQNGDSGKRILNNSRNNFERNKIDEFSIQCVELGEISRIHIGHDGANPGSGWFLDKVTIVAGDGTSWFFLAGRWLDTNEDDKKLEVDLVAQKEDGEASKPLVSYRITVLTGDRRGAGTDANVFVNIVGEFGETGQISLDNSQNNFERKKDDVFDIRVVDLGEIKKIRIGHDNSGFGPGWFLDKVTIHDEKRDKNYYFLCGKWLASDEGDGQIMREISSSENGVASEPLKQYEITVITGDRRGAGTSADVSITLFGEKGDTGSRKLDNAKKWPTFTRGGSDVFSVESVNLGELKKIIIGHNNKGIGAGWFLDKVIVKDLNEFNKQWYFLCGRWLADDEDDKQIVREIPAEGKDGQTYDPVITYNITVLTADRRGAGTDAKVYINITGTKGNSGDRTLDGEFERSSVDKFSIDCVDLGDITKIRVGHDNTGVGPGWFLDKVIIRNTHTSQEYYFLAGRWIAKDEDDGKIVIELTPKNEDGVATVPLINYRVTIYTGDVRGAGTDANVFVVVYGDKGNTGEKQLDAPRKAFERKSVDPFGIETLDLGVLQKIRIGHDGSGVGSGWFLDKVVIRNEVSGEEWYFLCGRWLDSTEDDGKIVRDLPASTQDGKSYNPPINYLLEVYTADRKGAGTKSNVFVTIYGDSGDTGEQQLEGHNAFKSGQSDQFEINSPDLGKLTKINVRHDNSGFGSNASWFVDKIVVTNQNTGSKSFFLIGKLLDIKKGDKKINIQVAAQNEDGVAVLPLTVYKVTIETANASGAGTNANVFIQIFGDNGDSGLSYLDGPSDAFDKGKVTPFGLELVDIGDIKKVKIGHDNSGLWAGWYCSKFSIRNEKTGKEWLFPINQWFDKDKGDKLIVREVFPAEGSGKVSTLVSYQIDIATANIHLAGTEANVFIQLYGTDGHTDKIPLKGKFDRGQSSKHDTQSVDLGALTMIRLGHDNAGISPGWLVDRVTVKNLRTDDTYLFPVNQWFAKGEGDSKIVRDIQVVDDEKKP